MKEKEKKKKKKKELKGKNNMKQNVKNMINNMQDMNEIEGKSVSIKDTSFQFQKDSRELEKKMRRAALRNKIIIGVVIIAVAGLAIYALMK